MIDLRPFSQQMAERADTNRFRASIVGLHDDDVTLNVWGATPDEALAKLAEGVRQAKAKAPRRIEPPDHCPWCRGKVEKVDESTAEQRGRFTATCHYLKCPNCGEFNIEVLV